MLSFVLGSTCIGSMRLNAARKDCAARPTSGAGVVVEGAEEADDAPSDGVAAVAVQRDI